MVDYGLFLRQTKPHLIAEGGQRCGDVASESANLPRSKCYPAIIFDFEKTDLGAEISEPVIDSLLGLNEERISFMHLTL